VRIQRIIQGAKMRILSHGSIKKLLLELGEPDVWGHGGGIAVLYTAGETRVFERYMAPVAALSNTVKDASLTP